MIDFRYHLVSLVSVFLALAIGLVLGATVLKPWVVRGLQATAKAEHHQIDQLIVTGKLNRQQLAADEAFAQTAEPQLLAHLLEGQRVVIVAAPGAPASVVNGVTGALHLAGATVSGEVQLQSRFFDPSPGTQQILGQLAQQVAPATLTLTGPSAVEQASQVLASAIITSGGLGQPAPGVADSAGHTVLSGLQAGSFLSVSGSPLARATLAVVVTPGGPPSASDSSPQSQGLVTLAQALGRAGNGTVVAGPVAGSGTGSAIDVMRAGNRAGHLSSVDDADLAIGQIAVAQALYEQLHGVSGAYGVTASAQGPGPSPAPTPSATASPSPTRRATSATTARPAASPSPSGRH